MGFLELCSLVCDVVVVLSVVVELHAMGESDFYIEENESGFYV